MPLSWNEVRDRAIRFSREWQGETREEAEAKSFWDAFFEVFGIKRRAVASFEEPVHNLRGQYGYIDLFWPGKMLVEHKSRGQNLTRAESQAFAYIRDLARENRHDEIPRYVIVSDFARVVLHDLEPDDQRGLPLFDKWRVRTVEFPLAELHRHVREFAFLKGEKPVRLDPEDPANEKAYRIMADLHDALDAGGFTGHELERFLVRVLFCLFAEDNGIFEPCAFQNFLQQRTREDGSDLGAQLNRLFDVLNQPEHGRQRNLDEDLAALPYVNGALFAERLGFADFNRDMRNALLAGCRFQWARISPAVFGSLFQGIMQPRERRQQGGHYTSERNILKVVRSLFLDDLRAELDAIKADRSRRRRARLEELHQKLRRLRFLDPACGCGNFLVVTYRELRRLELEVLRELFGRQRELTLDQINRLSRVDVDQFYGLELSEWPVRIAEVALWLMDHQMNQELTEAFSQRYRRLPLRSTPHIVQGNALRLDWKQILPPAQCSFVLGNPPFVGKKEQNAEQKADMDLVWAETKGTGILDYVTCWYRKAAEYIQRSRIRCAFVSTNSISQGEQVGVLWDDLFNRWRIKIHFAHRTFAWESEARGKAHVHVVIVGFGAFDHAGKRIYESDRPDGEATVSTAININPYLLQGGDTTVRTRTTPINAAPAIFYGSMMIDQDRSAGDDAGLILTPERRAVLIAESPALAPFIRRLYGGEEFLNGTERWCLWLVDAPPTLIRTSPLLRARIETVRAFREQSNRPQTKALATTPTLFGEIRQPSTPYLLLPKVSSHARRYLPIGFLTPDIIASGSALIVPDATLFHFGILSSAMHNAWMRCVAGRMKSDYQYSNNIVYNNYPWPENASARAREAVEAAARRVLAVREKFLAAVGADVRRLTSSQAANLSRQAKPEPPNAGSYKTRTATLADLYDPLAMPPELVAAHADLDRAVDRCYRDQPFTSDRQRVEYLFALYEQLTAPLVAAARPRRRKRSTPGKAD